MNEVRTIFLDRLSNSLETRKKIKNSLSTSICEGCKGEGAKKEGRGKEEEGGGIYKVGGMEDEGWTKKDEGEGIAEGIRGEEGGRREEGGSRVE